jgi:ABC-type Zn2+ transport system substrate-binding protein/surface adhesin
MQTTAEARAIAITDAPGINAFMIKEGRANDKEKHQEKNHRSRPSRHALTERKPPTRWGLAKLQLFEEWWR